MNNEDIVDNNFVIIKIGGSSITDKAKTETLNKTALEWFSHSIASSVHERYLSTTKNIVTKTASEACDNVTKSTSIPRNKASFIIVHGAGSFGHQCAKKFGLSGKSKPPARKKANYDSNFPDIQSSQDAIERKRRHIMSGLAETRASVKRLNNEVVSHLIHAGINAVGISPCINIPGVQAHGGDEYEGITSLVKAIIESLSAGLVPVIHGDAGLYGYYGENGGRECMSAGILGGDTLVEVIAMHKRLEKNISKAIFVTDVTGVYTKDPNLYNDAKLLKKIDIDPISGEILSDLTASGSSHAHDVTGGLETKLGAAAKIAKTGVDCIIVKCISKDGEKAIQGSAVDLGTVVRASNTQTL